MGEDNMGGTYVPRRSETIENQVKELKKKYNKKVKHKAVHAIYGITRAFNLNEFPDYHEFLSKIVKSIHPEEIKYIRGITVDFLAESKRTEKGSWGPASNTKIRFNEGDISDAVKGTLFLRIVTGIIIHKLGLDPIDAVELIQEKYGESAAKEINHVIPRDEHREQVIKILQKNGKKYNLDDETIGKIADLMIEVGRMLHEGIGHDPDTQTRLINLFGELYKDPDHSVGKRLLETLPELREAIDRHSDRITQLADELAELGRKREATEEAIKSGKVYDEIFARLDRLEEKVNELARKVDELVELLRLLSKEG